jgi:hypothetical protein
MIRSFILAFGVTLSGVIVGILQKKKLSIWRCLFIFILMFFLNYTISSLGAKCVEKKNSYIENIDITRDLEVLVDHCILEREIKQNLVECFEIVAKVTNPEVASGYESNIRYHRKEGEYYFKLAQQRIYFLPNWDARKLCQNCFESVLNGTFNAVSFGSITAGVAGAVIYMLMKYGVDMYEGWFGINEALEKAQWHFAMEEWYFRELHQDFKKNEPYREKPHFSGRDRDNTRMFEI